MDTRLLKAKQIGTFLKLGTFYSGFRLLLSHVFIWILYFGVVKNLAMSRSKTCFWVDACKHALTQMTTDYGLS